MGSAAAGIAFAQCWRADVLMAGSHLPATILSPGTKPRTLHFNKFLGAFLGTGDKIRVSLRGLPGTGDFRDSDITLISEDATLLLTGFGGWNASKSGN